PRDRVGGGNDYGDGRGQLYHWWAFQSLGEIAVCRQAVVPVRGSDMLGALCIQLAELGVATVRAQIGDDISVAPLSQLGDAGAPVGSVTEQLRSKEHVLDFYPAVRQLFGCFRGEGGAGRVSPQQNLLQTTRGDFSNDLLHNALQRTADSQATPCSPDHLRSSQWVKLGFGGLCQILCCGRL